MRAGGGLKFVFNGNIQKNKTLLQKYPQSQFIDQTMFHKLIYDFQHLSKLEVCNSLRNHFIFTLFCQNRIHLFYNYTTWSDFLKANADFSYGQRIHGNIIALLNGIPAFVDVIDSRTREIAEFYHIPNSYQTSFDPRKDSLVDLYRSLDYTSFNEIYKQRFQTFCHFLDSHQIPHTLKDNAKFKNHLQSLTYSFPPSINIPQEYKNLFYTHQIFKPFFKLYNKLKTQE